MSTFSSKNNFVNDSVILIRDTIKSNIKSFYSIIKKYSIIQDKLNEKLDLFKYTDIDINTINKYSFTRSLFIIDKNLYSKFISEINESINTNSCTNIFNKYISKKSPYSDDNNYCLNSISYLFLGNLYNQFDRFNEPHFDYEYTPMMLIKPSVSINMPSDHYNGDLSGKINNFIKDVNINKMDVLSTDLSYKFNFNGLNLIIDIDDVCDSIYSIILLEKNNKEDCIKDKCLDIVFKIMYYSAVTTYLATISKLSNSFLDINNSIINDILVSCKNTMNKSFGYDGEPIDNTEEGAILRNMSISLSTVLNNLKSINNRYNKETEFENNKLETLFLSLIKSLISSKFETYNYIKVPTNNFKHKDLININELAKRQLYYLDEDVKLELNDIFDYLSKAETGSKPYYKNIFLPLKALKINNTYSHNKRLYSSIKYLIDTLGKFLTIKQRITFVGNRNITNSTLDNINKSFRDYRTFLIATYKTIIRSLGLVSNNITDLLYNRQNTKLSKNKDEIFINNIFYGVNLDTNIDALFDELDILLNDKSFYDITKIERDTYKCAPKEKNCYNDRINYIKYFMENIFKIYEKMNKNSTFVDINYIKNIDTNNLVSSWVSITKFIAPFMFYNPLEFDRGSYYNVESIIEYLKSYQYEDDMLNVSNSNDFNNIDGKTYNEKIDYESVYYSGGIGTLNTSYKNYDNNTYSDSKMTYFSKSIEELENNFDDLRVKFKNESNEDLFGLFNNFAGFPLASDITGKELEMMNASQNPEWAAREDFNKVYDKFIKLRDKYDRFINKIFN